MSDDQGCVTARTNLIACDQRRGVGTLDKYSPKDDLRAFKLTYAIDTYGRWKPSVLNVCEDAVN